MKFAVFSLVPNGRNAVTGKVLTQQQQLRQVVDNAILAEELGFDAYGVGERHDKPFLSSAPPVILAAIAERTSRIRLLTSVTVISILDPVRVAEDYATVDQLSGGRLELVIGKGSDPALFTLFGLDQQRQWEYQAEKFELLRRLWREEKVTWSGRFRAPLARVTTQPRPLQSQPTIWHGSASSVQSTDLAAKWGDPLFTANSSCPKEKYAALVNDYRQRWADYGHNPVDALVGSGCGGFYVARTSQEAVRHYRPYYEAISQIAAAKGKESEFSALEDKIARGSALVGSPKQIIDKVLDYHGVFGHQVQALTVDGLTEAEQRATLELFMSEVAPTLREEIPSTVWG